MSMPPFTSAAAATAVCSGVIDDAVAEGDGHGVELRTTSSASVGVRHLRQVGAHAVEQADALQELLLPVDADASAPSRAEPMLEE